jgi:hypothetical protein
LTISSMNWRVVAIISSMLAIRAAFDSSMPRMISRYFGIAFSSSVGPPLGPRTLTSNEWPADRHGPGEISRRDAADPSDPRCARQSKSLSDG